MQGLGAEDITDHEIVKKLLRSLDSSFDALVLMIKERPDFKSLDPADVMERLNTHEAQEEEKRDMYGYSYRENHALKAAADSSLDAEDNADEDSDDPDSIIKDLVQMTRRIQHFLKKSLFSKKNLGSNSKSSRDYTCFKCWKTGHLIPDCPMWEVEARASSKFNMGSSKNFKNKRNSYDSDDEKKKKKFSKKKDNSSLKSSSRTFSKYHSN